MIKTLAKILFIASVAMTFLPITSFAVPSYARQTGMNCAACHTSFPELTPFGREFKLNGYTLGERQLLPLAAMMQFSMTSVAKNHDASGAQIMLHQNDPQFDVLGLFAAGKLSDYAGMFVQWTYSNNGSTNGDGKIVGHSGLDNTDIRAIMTHDVFGKNTVFGLNLNNNPSVQDVWNTTPAWGFPYNGPNLPNVPGPSFTSSIIEGGLSQQVAGIGAYVWYDRHLYGELSFYGNANKAFRILSAGQSGSDGSITQISGRNNPYWRLAWNEDWGAHSLMVGTYGMQVDKFPDSLSPYGPTDRFRDTALDAQYQFLSDPHIVTVQTTFIHEKQDNRASYDLGNTANPQNHLNTFKVKASYLYDRKYGASLAYFDTTGSNDAIAFNSGNNLVTKPDTQSYVMQLDYNPWTFARVSLQYTGYIKFDGSREVDLAGFKPRDRNTLFLSTWFAF